MIGDLTNFMAYMAEPAKRTSSILVLLCWFLGVMLVLAKKIAEYWKDIK
jgi:ubiquinol-cytochrome c reductase cytochrome c1 subunit